MKTANLELFAAIERNDIAGVESALKNGADINQPDKFGMPPLVCCSDKDISLVEYLLKMGADPDSVNRRGDTLIHTIMYNSSDNTEAEDKEKIKLVLSYDANPYVLNNNGESIFSYAISYTDKSWDDIAELIASKGYEPEEEDFQFVEDRISEITKYIEMSKEQKANLDNIVEDDMLI